MSLFILRHGIATELNPHKFARDSERPLTPKGKRKLWESAEAMEAMELAFDLIVSSPYLRARQTAEIIAEAFNGRKEVLLSEHLTPGGSHKALVAWLNDLKPLPNDVLLVGHEPYLSEFISLLISGGTGCSIALKKGGLCKLSAETLEAGRCAMLEWLVTPKQMSLMV